MKILFLGQNPAIAAISKGESRAFFGTRSGSTLSGWIKEAGIPESACDFANVCEHPTLDNARPRLRDVEASTLVKKLNNYNGIVVLGKFARSIVEKIEHEIDASIVYLEHPSGLNRNLNDEAKIAECVRKIRLLYDKVSANV